MSMLGLVRKSNITRVGLGGDSDDKRDRAVKDCSSVPTGWISAELCLEIGFWEKCLDVAGLLDWWIVIFGERSPDLWSEFRVQVVVIFSFSDRVS